MSNAQLQSCLGYGDDRSHSNHCPSSIRCSWATIDNCSFHTCIHHCHHSLYIFLGLEVHHSNIGLPAPFGQPSCRGGQLPPVMKAVVQLSILFPQAARALLWSLRRFFLQYGTIKSSKFHTFVGICSIILSPDFLGTVLKLLFQRKVHDWAVDQFFAKSNSSPERTQNDTLNVSSGYQNGS